MKGFCLIGFSFFAGSSWGRTGAEGCRSGLKETKDEEGIGLGLTIAKRRLLSNTVVGYAQTRPREGGHILFPAAQDLVIKRQVRTPNQSLQLEL